MKKKRFISLNIKVFLLTLAVMVISTTMVGSLLYRKSIDIVKQKQETLVKNAFRNISDSLDVNMKNAHSISLYIISDDMIRNSLINKEMTKNNKLERQNEILGSLAFFTGQNSYIDNIYIVGANRLSVFSGKTYRNLSEDDRKEAEDKKGGAVWKWKTNSDGSIGNLSLLREIRNTENPKEVLGILRIDISSIMLNEQFQSFTEAYPGHIAIWNEDGTEIYSYGERQAVETSDEILQKVNMKYDWMESLDKKANILSYYYCIPDSDWFLESSTQYASLYAENSVIRELLIIGILISLLLCSVIVYIFSNTILRPLKLLTKKIGDIADENYKIHLEVRSNDEIGMLSTNFNSMAKKLDELVNEVLKGKILQRDARFMALQAQINPHFLYNNLDTAYWMSRLEKADKTGKIILSLSALYRSAVSTTDKIVSVETEVCYAKDYIVIQQLRLDEAVQFEVEVEEDVLNYTTLRFVIQPLVENSIQHGILPTGEAGTICIQIYRKDESLYFCIEDSGQGYSIEDLTRLLEDTESEEKRGMAIRNIHQRIKLQFGSEYGLHFEDIKSGGMRVIAKQPLVPYDKTTTAD